MNSLALLEAKEEAIAALCRRYEVKRLWLFGSAITDRFDPRRSDIDLVVEFGQPVDMSLAAQYFDFWEDLKELLEREVDLVERSAIRNSVFLRNIERQERLLYAAWAEKLLTDARAAGRAVLDFVRGRSLRDYQQDLMLRSAVERQLFILGEAMAQLRSIDPERFDRVPDSRRMVGFRNLLAHGYAEVDDARAWDIVENDLPATLREIERMLRGA